MLEFKDFETYVQIEILKQDGTCNLEMPTIYYYPKEKRISMYWTNRYNLTPKQSALVRAALAFVEAWSENDD